MVQNRLMPTPLYSSLENLLNDLISNSNMEKTFLFDVVSKIYIATDSTPVDMQSYELCSDMIDVVRQAGSQAGRQAGRQAVSDARDDRSDEQMGRRRDERHFFAVFSLMLCMKTSGIALFPHSFLLLLTPSFMH